MTQDYLEGHYMDSNQFKHNRDLVLSTLKKMDNKVFATKPTKIYIPVRFLERGMATISTDTFICGIFGIVINDSEYATMIMNGGVKITPTKYVYVTIDNVDYVEFYFEPGSVIIDNTAIVKRDVIVYQIYDEFIYKGNIPWYMDYLKVGKLFKSSKQYAGANVGQDREITELIASLITRDKKDRMKYYRQVVNTPEDLKKKPAVFIPLRSVTYGATNTLNKLAGSYMHDGVISALVSPSERVEHVEKLLTM